MPELIVWILLWWVFWIWIFLSWHVKRDKEKYPPLVWFFIFLLCGLFPLIWILFKLTKDK